MVLLDHVVAADDESLCAAVQVREDSLFYVDGAVGGWVGLEYMAQAIGAFAGFQARLRGTESRGSRRAGAHRLFAWYPALRMHAVTLRLRQPFKNIRQASFAE